MAIPHVDSMSYTDNGALDPACYWHGTIEELRGKGDKVSISCLSSSHYLQGVGMGEGKMVLEEVRF